ncbi:MAG: MFS transporter [Acidobacteriaceae bacterium]|nr:MFS transporter [Acidobacteriaceae bacterium]
MKTRPAHAFRAMKNYNFRLWTAGALVSNTGTWMQRVAQDWLVLTQLTHHNATAVGIVMALQFGPQFLMLPWSGLAADRFDQRKLLMLTQASMGILAAALGILTISGHARLWHVYIFAFVFGVAAALDAPARQTFVGVLVGDDDLHNAVSLNSTSFNAGQMIGPAVAGLVIAKVGTGWAFLLNGLSFGAVLLSMSLFRIHELRTRARAPRAPGGFREGFRYVWNRPDLRAILVMLFLVGTFGLNFPIYISTMAVKVFHTDARGFGLLSSTMSIGTLTGALLSAMGGRRTFRSLLVGCSIFGVGCALAAMAPGYWWFAASLALIGIAALTFMTTTNSMMQLSTEPTMRGRVMALRVGVALGGTPIGAPIAGWVANRYGPRWSLGIGAISGFLAAAVAGLLLSRSRESASRKTYPEQPV